MRGAVHFDPTTPLSEQAAHWWVTLNGEDCTENDRRDFAAWVSHSPDRVEAYLRVVTAMSTLVNPSVPWPDTPVDVLVREAKSNRNVEPLAVQGDRHSRRYVPRPLIQWMSGLAAAVLLALGVPLLIDQPQRYHTGVGEQLSVRLSDGSLVKMNTMSEVELSFDANRRGVSLISGEALFQVAHDPSRPFDVSAGQAQIRAVGTEFNVSRRDASTTITVLEGRVIVSRPEAGNTLTSTASPTSDADAPVALDPAERLVMNDSGSRSIERISDITAVTAWTQRRLVFERRTMGEVADEFNRFNREKIRIDDDALRQEQVTGVFQADDPQSFLAFIAKIPGVKIGRTEGVQAVTVEKVASDRGPD